MTRGEKNNNPCNIRKSSSAWLGKIIPSQDPDFEEFDLPVDGIRAAAKLFLNYYRSHKLDCVSDIINRWAPGVENNTPAYIDDVCSRMFVAPNDELDLTNAVILQALVTSVIWHENGEQPYDEGLIEQAIQEALST